MKRQLITSAVLLLALTACGQDDGTPPPEGQANDVSTEAPTPETLTPGTYEYELNGGTMTLEVPATIPQEAIDPIEALRGALNAPEVTYIVGEADNRNGTEQLSPSEITLFDKGGKEYLFQSASTYIGDNLSPTMNEDYSYSYPDGTPMAEGQYDILNEQSIEIYNSHLNQGKPGAKDTQVWIYEGTDFPDEFTNLEVDEGPDGSIMPTPA